MTDFSGPIGKLHLGYKVTRTLGWRWVLTRAYLEAERRSGVLERRTPVTTWDSYELEGDPAFDLRGLHPEAAGECLRAQPPEVEAHLRRHLEYLKERRFDVFGTRVQIDDWHHDPIDDAFYPPDRHWSRVPELPYADLKLVWEPSRFGWAFDLARLHALDPTSSAPEVFWGLFEDWCAANQPFAGVHWKCGQEAAVRLIATAFAVKSFGNSHLTPDRRLLLAKFGQATARRIASHWRYAQSQRNNHVAAEAAGLLTYALLWPGASRSALAYELGQRLARNVCEQLIFSDGGTSQYSSQYHVVFIEYLLWIAWLYKSTETIPPPGLNEAIFRASNLLCAIANPSDGHAAQFGSNDGSRVLPLQTNCQNDVRPKLYLAALFVDSDWLEGKASMEEPERWLLASTSRPCSTGIQRTKGPKIRCFDQGGIAVIDIDGCRAVIRTSVSSNFRPSQCDFGHVELWIDGLKVVTDLGTLTYKPRCFDEDFGLTRFHNAPVPVDHEQMRRLGRFMWSQPPEVKMVPKGLERLPSWSWDYKFFDGFHLRRTIQFDSGWRIIDRTNRPAVATWILPSTEDESSHSYSRPHAYTNNGPTRTITRPTTTDHSDPDHHYSLFQIDRNR